MIAIMACKYTPYKFEKKIFASFGSIFSLPQKRTLMFKLTKNLLKPNLQQQIAVKKILGYVFKYHSHLFAAALTFSISI